MAKKKRRFITWDGIERDCYYIAKRTNRTYDTILIYITRGGCKTQQDILDKIEKLKELKKRGRTLCSIVHNTLKGKLTVKEMYECHPDKDKVSPQIIRNRVQKYGGMSPAVWYPKSSQKEFAMLLAADGIVPPCLGSGKLKKLKPVKIDTLKICYRGDFSTRCKFYNSCSDDWVFKGKHHKRFIKNGSCYTKDIGPQPMFTN